MDRITRDKCCDAKNSCTVFVHDCLNCGPMGRIAKDKCWPAKHHALFLFMVVLAAVQWTAYQVINLVMQNQIYCHFFWFRVMR